MSESNTYVLEARGISKYFYTPQKFQVLHAVDLQIPKGEFVAIMGKSGSGKSTLLYVLSTLDTDFEGELIVNGETLSGKTEKQLAGVRSQWFGFVFQFHYLLLDFSVLENVMIPALKLGRYSREEIEQRAMEKLRLLDIPEQALKPANRLSGGQQQRVAIARALINDPLLILGDEPTGNLDSKNTANVLAILRELSQEFGQTIVAVTHDPDFVERCDRLVLLKDGRIVESLDD